MEHAVCVRLWHPVDGLRQSVFSFTGTVDTAVLDDLLRCVERLVQHVPGRCHFDVIASPHAAPLLGMVAATVHDLRRRGFSARLALRVCSYCAPAGGATIGATPPATLH